MFYKLISFPQNTKSEYQIAVQSTQFQYGVDYFVDDFVNIEHQRFGIRQNKIQLVGGTLNWTTLENSAASPLAN